MASADSPQDRPVIAGVDRGPHQDDVVRFAAREAALRRRPLLIAHAIDLPLPGASPSDQEGSGSAAEAGARLVDHYEQLARKESPSLSVAGELHIGHAAATPIERSADAEMIVVGHRGGGGFPRLPLGSVSWQVATHAECPVIVVRPDGTEDLPDNRVVAGVDTDEASLQALDVAYEEAALRDARLDIVHCAVHIATSPAAAVTTMPVDFPVPRGGPQEFFDEELAKRRERYPDVEANFCMRHVPPAPQLVEASGNACLLVVGSRRRTGVRRFLLGSVSGEVLHTAHCPVAVVPVHGDA
ncbi:universal stress protein [Streptomyces peucetius]|uniref:Universal stress protein n=1 Tax=Streptomyces peucetius TaxID=1950 RepID=A0ABY6IBR3_STRPE|nr:universal stress protein [Streptomyces peucetius]UYQ63160.1 universal stress protein [Streptomyces peucetius]